MTGPDEMTGTAPYPHLSPPYWVHAVLWLPLIVMLPLALLRPLKGIFIASQFRYDASEGRLADGE